MNKIILSGNLGHSATTRDVPKADGSGSTPVVNFSLAVKIGFGERAETLWYGCSWWGERAAKVALWLSKGRRVIVEGEPGLRLYAKRDGSAGAEITVRVGALELLGDGQEREGANGASRVDEAAPAVTSAGAVTVAKIDDDVPF